MTLGVASIAAIWEIGTPEFGVNPARRGRAQRIPNPEAPTPRIGDRMAEALRLDRHYAFRYCSPTRRSFRPSLDYWQTVAARAVGE